MPGMRRHERSRHAALLLMRIVSGGQTGVDRAALDAAMAAGLEVGGWCPRGRRALDGPIPPQYPLIETRSSRYRTRTRWNVRDADATLILYRGALAGGTALTLAFCKELGRPYFVHELADGERDDLAPVKAWIQRLRPSVLNVAGPRETRALPVYDIARHFLERLFRALA